MPAPAPQVETVMNPTVLALAGNYAQAMMDYLCKDRKRGDEPPSVAETAAELAEIAGLMNRVDGLETQLTAPVLDAGERLATVEKIFDGKVSQPTVAFLGVLARKGRMGLLRDISRRFGKMIDIRKGRLEVSLSTAVELDEPHRSEAAAELSKAIGEDVVLNLRVDPKLLGGMAVRIGDRLYDASLSGRLAKIRRMLGERLAGTGNAGTLSPGEKR